MRKYILVAIVALLFASCGEYKYPKDKEVSNKEGALVDSLGGYLLENIEFDGINHVFEWNLERLEEVNDFYRLTSEPILYNYYLGRDIYRLALVEKGKSPLLFSVNRGDKRSWVVSKRIDQTNLIQSDSVGVDSIPSLMSFYDNYTRDLNVDELQKFDSLWQTIDFYHLSSSTVLKDKYENYCLIEAHEKNKYWYVYRSLDDTSFKKMSEYIRNLSGF